jgi:hypothetical protein
LQSCIDHDREEQSRRQLYGKFLPYAHAVISNHSVGLEQVIPAGTRLLFGPPNLGLKLCYAVGGAENLGTGVTSVRTNQGSGAP